MKKFSYAEEFNRVSDVVRLGDADDVQINYGVFIGEPDCENTFLDSGQFVCQDHFTTYSDAQQAKVLVQTVLGHVDEHKKNNATAERLPRNLRHEIYRCVGNSVDKMLKYRDDELFGEMLIAELIYTLNGVLAKYNNNPARCLDKKTS